MILRGDVFWADLGEPQGGMPAKLRPVLVVQEDSYNRSEIKTVLVVTVTSQTRLADLPGNVFLPAADSGLPKDSVANVSQVFTLNKYDLTDHAGHIPADLMVEVGRGLATVFGL